MFTTALRSSHTYPLFQATYSSQTLPVKMRLEKTLHTSPDGANPPKKLRTSVCPHVCSKAAAAVSLLSPAGCRDQAHVTWTMTFPKCVKNRCFDFIRIFEKANPRGLHCWPKHGCPKDSVKKHPFL